MPKILKLAKREYLESVKTKGFLIMLIMMPLVMGGSGIAMMLFKGQVDTSDKRVAVVDHSGVVTGMLRKAFEARNGFAVFDARTGKKVQPAYLLEVIEPNEKDLQGQKLELSDRIRRGGLHAFLEVGANVLHPRNEEDASRLTYHAKNAAVDPVRNWLNNVINNDLRKLRMTEAGLDTGRVDGILAWVQVEPLGLLSADATTGEVREARRSSEAEAVLVPLVLFFLMFLMVMMGAMPLLSSTQEEKTQRIAEVLLGCLEPHEFMAGKVLGSLAVSLTGATVYVTGGIVLLNALDLARFIPVHVIPWFFIYLVLEIVMVGSYLAALGASCNDPKDAQNIQFPAMIPIFLSVFLAMPILQEPTSGFATALSLFPLFTPMLMLLRKATPVGIPGWQPWVGLVGVMILTAFSVWAGGRIFRVAILMQGGAPKLSLGHTRLRGKR
jgi:ABC-2 type transport system permease protein